MSLPSEYIFPGRPLTHEELKAMIVNGRKGGIIPMELAHKLLREKNDEGLAEAMKKAEMGRFLSREEALKFLDDME